MQPLLARDKKNVVPHHHLTTPIGVNNVLDESLFEETLAVNDAVARVLEAAIPIATAPAGSRPPQSLPSSSSSGGASGLRDLTNFGAAPSASGAASSSSSAAGGAGGGAGASDLLGLFSSAAAPTQPQPPQAKAAAPSPSIVPALQAAVYNPFDSHVAGAAPGSGASGDMSGGRGNGTRLGYPPMGANLQQQQSLAQQAPKASTPAAPSSAFDFADFAPPQQPHQQPQGAGDAAVLADLDALLHSPPHGAASSSVTVNSPLPH